MKKFNLQEQKTLIFIIIFACVFLFIYFKFLLNPKISELKKLKPKLEQLTRDVSTVKIDLARKDALETKFKDSSKTFEEQKQKLIRQVEIPALLENISLMAASSEVKLVTLKPSGESIDIGKDEIYRVFPISITAESGYHQLGAFVNAIENSAKFMKVSNITIKQNTADPKANKVDLEIYAFVMLEN